MEFVIPDQSKLLFFSVLKSEIKDLIHQWILSRFSTSLRPVDGTDDIDCKLNADYNEHGEKSLFPLFVINYYIAIHI